MNHSNAGVALIRLLGSESDFISFYIDHIFSENFVDHAQFRQNLIRIAKASDILPKLCSTSKTILTISRVDGIEGDIFIPKRTRFARTDGLGYLTDTDVIMSADMDTVSTGVSQGELVEIEIASSLFRVEDYGKRLRYNLGPDMAAGTCSVRSKDYGEIWTEVDSFYRSFEGANHYCLELHADPVDGVADTVYLTLNRKFGDRDLPEALQISFVRTSKEEGNTGIDTITVCPPELEPYVWVTNPRSATGGGGLETAEQLRMRIPAATGIQRRAVTKTDYVALVSGIPGVRYCECYDRTDDSGWPHMHVVVYVTPEGGGRMSEALKEMIWLKCAEKGHLGSWRRRYILKDMEQIPVNLEVTVGLVERHDPDSVFTNIRLKLTETYNLQGVTSIKLIRFSDIHSIISHVPGVSWVEFNSPMVDHVAGEGSILVLGSVTLRLGA